MALSNKKIKNALLTELRDIGTYLIADIINKARRKQRSFVITLLDLKNAFGEVHHNLIRCVLDYQHILESLKPLIACPYTNLPLFKHYHLGKFCLTPYLLLQCGMLQGDCPNPVLFNLCFPFVQFVKRKYKSFGLSPHDGHDRLFKPIRWFKLAGDSAVIKTDEPENQLLLNCFSKWCHWSNMLFQVDKCNSFSELKRFPAFSWVSA